MNTTDLLHTIKDYIDANRRVGHTTAMIRGAQNMDSVIVLARNSHQRDWLAKQLPNATVKILARLDPTLGKPLVIDNEALYEICFLATEKIKRLENEIESLKQSTPPQDAPLP